jgi:hypothetical protein
MSIAQIEHQYQLKWMVVQVRDFDRALCFVVNVPVGGKSSCSLVSGRQTFHESFSLTKLPDRIMEICDFSLYVGRSKK